MDWLLKKIQLVRSFVRYRERRSEQENDTQADRETKGEGLQEDGELVLGPMSPFQT